MRRPGAGASIAARAGWFARGLGVRRGMISEELGLDDDDLWDSVVGGVGVGADDDAESAIESLAMHVAGEGGGPNRNRLMERQQRFMDAARAFSQATSREPHNTDPVQLLQFASENAAYYQPVWSKPSSTVSGRSRAAALSATRVCSIEVGEGERCNLAHLPSGSGQGFAVRAEPALPRSDALSPFRMPSVSNNHNSNNTSPARSPLRKVFGFRVAFDHPRCEQGGDMGGCYLIGVTSSAFTAYSDQNGLQQSPYFWGIEDNGQRYEGSRYNQTRGSRRSTSSSSSSPSPYAMELGPAEAPRNAAGVLFGSREVITVIVDLESRTLTFWRDENLLGTLVHSIPRNGNIFPVAVPFNFGVTVAITGLDRDPIPL